MNPQQPHNDFQWSEETLLEYSKYLVREYARSTEWTQDYAAEQFHLHEFMKKKNGEKRSPEYEILSYRYKPNNSIMDNKGYEEFVHQLCANPELFAIHSVKRLSDGEVFQIGDTVYHVEGLYPVTITEFYQPPLERGEMWFYWSSFKETVKNLDNFKKQESLISPPKVPLFRTEDGVDIYKGTTFYEVSTERWDILAENEPHQPPYDQYYKYFANKYNAERYVLLNKPTLTVKEVMDLFPANTGEFGDFIERVTKLAKSKL